jgi:precorrin-2 dehydrogenase/sirohydrochlorin ferrochelatase
MEYYPVFIDLKGKTVLVLGQYRVLEFKIKKLIEAGAKIRLISDILPENLKELTASSQVEFLGKEFQEKHLNNIWLVICGTFDSSLKEKVLQLTSQRRIFCNFVDEPDICSFISPSVITRGDITIAISTRGKSPALNKLIKRKISDLIGDEYNVFAELMGKIRPKVLKNISDQKQRGEVFDAVVKHTKLLDLIKAHEAKRAEDLIFEIVDNEIENRRDYAGNQS